MSSIEQKLKDLNITLPIPAAPVASYVTTVISGNTLYVSGQLPIAADGSMIKGTLGNNVDTAQGAEAAKACAINLLAQAKAALNGDLSRITRLVKLGAFVASTADFTEHPKVVNGASDLMVAVLGDAGKHARSSVGVSSLPLGVAVEIDAIFEIK